MKSLNQESCEDAISRVETVKFLANHSNEFENAKIKMAFQAASSLVNNPHNLPPVTPKGVTVTDFADKCRECGREKVLDKIRAEIEQLPTKTRTNWDGCCPDIDYPEIEYVDVTKNKLLEIIDKYKAESEDKE